MTELSRNERIKEASAYLRGTLADGLTRAETGAIAEDDQQLVKFHGMYLQDDRDLRPERTRKKLEKAFSFMIRLRIPGGVCSPEQWLQLDRHRPRLRQRHPAPDDAADLPVPRRHQVEPEADDAGDRRRAARHARRLRRRQPQRARRLQPAPVAGASRRPTRWRKTSPTISCRRRRPIARSGSTARRSSAARRRWSSRSTAAPTCRGSSRPWSRCRRPTTSTSSPRTSASSPSLDEAGASQGWNVTVGGGMGMTHGEPDTYPRTADVMAFCHPEDALAVAEAVVTVQRDWGDRASRKHARLKYTIEDRGLAAFRAEVERRLGKALEEPRPFAFSSNGDRYGWVEARERTLTPHPVHRERAPARHRRRAVAPDGPAPHRRDPRRRVPPDRQPERHRRQCPRPRTAPIIDALVAEYGLDRAMPPRCAATPWPASRCRPAASRSPRASATCPTS